MRRWGLGVVRWRTRRDGARTTPSVARRRAQYTNQTSFRGHAAHQTRQAPIYPCNHGQVKAPIGPPSDLKTQRYPDRISQFPGRTAIPPTSINIVRNRLLIPLHYQYSCPPNPTDENRTREQLSPTDSPTILRNGESTNACLCFPSCFLFCISSGGRCVNNRPLNGAQGKRAIWILAPPSTVANPLDLPIEFR